MSITKDGETPLYRYRFGDCEFNETSFELKLAGLAVKVQRKPLEVLAALLRVPGEVLSHEELLQSVWEGRPTVPNVLPNAISKLCKALGMEARRIVNLPRVGYRFEGPLERVAVGHRLSSGLALQCGMPVPRRENFALIEQLGRSKHSEVWLARHAKTGERRVYKFSPDGGRLASLKREATLFRLLRETLGARDDFVRIIDWNFEAEPFFLECEYGGQNLLQWAAEQASLEALSVPQRLDLFLQIGDAVAAAHSVGVLHKDLKPANVLIAPKSAGWQIRLTDFGSGRMLESGQLERLGITQLGLSLTQGVGGDSSIGTPLYLAPELIAGQPPTIQSDVYALGLLLYQLLVGDLHKPKVSGWQRDIADELLREDIDAASDGNLAHRIASVPELLNRLRNLQQRRERSLAQHKEAERAREAVEALRLSRARRPYVITVVMLAVGATIALLVGRQSLLHAYEKTAALNEFNSSLVKGFIGTANPSYSGHTNTALIQAAIKTAALIDSKPVSSSNAEIVATLHAEMQKMFSDLSQLSESISEGRMALAAFSQVGRPDLKTLINVKLRLVDGHIQRSEMKEAKEVLQSADLDIANLKTENSVERVLWLREHALIAIYSSTDEVDRYLQQAWALARKLPDDSDDTILLKESILFDIADNDRVMNRLPEAEAAIRDLIQRQTLKWGADSARTYYSMVSLGNILNTADKTDEALEIVARAADGLRATLGPEHRNTAVALNVLAGIYAKQHDFGKAAALNAEVLPIAIKLSGERGNWALGTRLELAKMTHFAGRPGDALPLYQTSLSESRLAFPEDNPVVQINRYWLADCLLDLHRSKEAKPLLEGLALQALIDSEVQNDWAGRLAYDQGRLAAQQGRPQDAIPLFEKAITVFKAAHTEQDDVLTQSATRDLNRLKAAKLKT